jgi:DNA-binding FrmR family transcriptional regulator
VATTTATDTTTPALDIDPGTDVACHTVHGYISDKSRYLARLKRIEGQARGIHRMVEQEKYCIDILTQVSALTKALESVALGLLDDHLRHCVMDAAAEGGPVAEARLKEASDAIARLVRS